MALSKLYVYYYKRVINLVVSSTRVSSRLYSDAPSCDAGGDDVPKDNTTNSDGGKNGLVLGVYEGRGQFELTPAAREVEQRSGGKLSRHLNKLSCELRLGKAFVVTDLGSELGAVALASLGPKDAGYNQLEALDEAKENVRCGVGAGVSLLRARGCTHVRVDPAGAPDAAAEAAHLAAWSFSEYKTSRQPAEASLSLYGEGGAEGAGSSEGAEGAELWQRGAVLGRAQNWARYLSDMPANRMTPVDLAQAALDTLCPLGVRVTMRDRDWLEANRMEAFLAVARGSCEAPGLLECEYRGAATQPVLLAAKGVTFDSGGLCLKPAEHMAENRGSMAGAAVSLAAVRALAELKVPVNVNVVVPLCENLLSGQCMKVGDVVRALNGLSIQIEDTDLEGRLMLADALVYGQAQYKPSLVVDVATLTRGVLLATGGGAFGCFSNSEAAWRALRAAGADSGDRPWRFPLWRYYADRITDEPSVDLRNKGSGMASPCLGAAFLKNFICGDWLHLDITGVGKLSHCAAPPYLAARRMSGRPTRTLFNFLEDAATSTATDDAKPPDTRDRQG